MIALDFCKKSLSEREIIVKEFRSKNLEGRQKSKISEIEKWCTKYLSDVDGNSFTFTSVVEASPDKLLQIKEYLDKTYDVSRIMGELPHGERYCYIETSLYTNMRDNAKRLLLKNLNVIVCPYCNRNYIFADENINTCELDHFIPKRKYPIFASSFYNLIPACPYCNGKKGEVEFKTYPHDQKKSTEDLMKFTYRILGSNYLTDIEDLDIELDILDEDYLVQANILKLGDLYKHHKDIVQDVLKKRHIFSDIYLDSLRKEFSILFETQRDIEELVYGISLKKEECGRRPLTKLLQDIVSEIKGKE